MRATVQSLSDSTPLEVLGSPFHVLGLAFIWLGGGEGVRRLEVERLPSLVWLSALFTLDPLLTWSELSLRAYNQIEQSGCAAETVGFPLDAEKLVS